MPTTLTLSNEGPWWDAEKMSPTMAALAVKLRAFFKVGPDAIGAKGDNAPGHMQGAHRSRAWIRNSIYCTNRSYTVSETPGNRSGGDDDWLAGMDIVIPAEDLIPMCQRLDEAVRAGKLEKITEWYGNDDGDNRVDGYNNIANVVASSDDSHLWHAHLTFDRGRAGENHDDVFAVLTGQATPNEGDDDMLFVGQADHGTTFWVGDGFYHRQLADANTANTLAAAAKTEVLNYGPNTTAAQLLAIIGPTPHVATASGDRDTQLLLAAINGVPKATADEIAADPERDGAGT